MSRYIDADNVKLKGISVFDQNLEVLIPLSDVRKALQMTPTADVQEVRHGRWINKGEYAVCTECGGRSGTQYNGVESIPLMTQYCPNCGAKMDGKEAKMKGGEKE